MTIFLVPTPLGNLRDITLRALDTLRECDLLVAEDSRVARKLLGALALPAKEIWTYNEHNAEGATAKILERARAERVVLTTDAGMPGISDPGCELVAAARAAGVAVDALPGPSAVLGAAVLSGFHLRRFVFEGFAPRTSAARRSAFARALAAGTSVWYESPQRIHAALADLEAIEPAARAFVLREYTKLHEQQIAGTPAQVAALLETPVRGEVVLVIEGRAPATVAPPDARAIDAAIDARLAAGASVASLAKELAEAGFGRRRDMYARATDRKREQRDRP